METDVSDIAQELTDRLRFSHVLLKSTKNELAEAKRAATKRKEKTERRIESLEQERARYKGRHREQLNKIAQLKESLHEQTRRHEALREAIAEKEAELSRRQNDEDRRMAQWERRLESMAAVQDDLTQRCEQYQTDLQQVKDVSRTRIMCDEARIRDLNERLRERSAAGESLAELLKENAELRGALEDACGCQASTTESASIDSGQGDWELCRRSLPSPALDLFEAFYRRNLDGLTGKKLQRDFEQLVSDVHATYQALHKQRLRQAQARYRRDAQALRRRYQQREHYCTVLDAEKLNFQQRQLKRLQQSLDRGDTPCRRALRSTAQQLCEIAHRLGQRSL